MLTSSAATLVCRRLYLILCFCGEVTGVVPLAELFMQLAAHPVDHAAAFHRLAAIELLSPALYIRV